MGKGKVVRLEFTYSSFQRSFALPKEVIIADIKATPKNGVLTTEIPKQIEFLENLSRQIKILLTLIWIARCLELYLRVKSFFLQRFFRKA